MKEEQTSLLIDLLKKVLKYQIKRGINDLSTLKFKLERLKKKILPIKFASLRYIILDLLSYCLT